MPEDRREPISEVQYRKLAADVKKLKPKHEPLPLRRYWPLGGKVMQVGNEYGEKRIEKLSRNTEWSHEMLYACLRFRRLWPKRSDLDRVVRRGLLFGHIRALSHKRLTAKEREKLERYVESERPGIRALGEKVWELIRGR